MSMQWGQYSKRIPLDQESPRAHAINTLARYLHAEEHGRKGQLDFGWCDQGWHTQTWFEHMATEIYDQGEGGR